MRKEQKVWRAQRQLQKIIKDYEDCIERIRKYDYWLNTPSEYNEKYGNGYDSFFYANRESIYNKITREMRNKIKLIKSLKSKT